MSDDLRVCRKCKCAKIAHLDFYCWKGVYRGECKACTIRKNVLYQQRVQAWKHRFVDDNQQRSYMADYYSKNKQKFAEYRRKFKEKYPDYSKEYFRKRKNEKYKKTSN